MGKGASLSERDPQVFFTGKRFGYRHPNTGETLIEPRYAAAMPFSEGLAAVRVKVGDDNKWGFIDASGAMVIEPRFAGATFFSEGLAAVMLSSFFDGKQVYIDRSGDVVIDREFDVCYPFEPTGTTTVVEDEEGRTIDRTGQFVGP